MNPVYTLGKMAACKAYGVSSVDRFTAGLDEDETPPPEQKKKEERAIIWSAPASPGETGLATGFGTGLGQYAGV